MPVNRQTVRELSRTTLYNITSSGQAWRAFLDAAARLYKYSFPEQVLIYAQEPEATACAAKEVWYMRMKRSLRPDAQAIALLDPHSHFGRLKYVFDVRETQPLPGAPEFRQWSLPFEALERVTDRLGQEYGISREPVVADRVYALVMNAPRELYPMQLTAMLRAADAEGRWSGQDDAALARQFHQLVADSAAYMAGVRVGIGTGAVTSDALESITRFNSSGLAALAGTYASRLAASVLRDVERAARENDRLAFPARGVQNESREEFSHAAEAAKEVQDNDIHNTEWSALPGSDAGGTGDGTGQIRPAAPQISGEKRPRSAEHPAAGGRAEQPSGTDRPSGARAGGADDGASGTAHEAAGQTDGPAWLGRDDEQPAPAGGGNGDGADLRQLSLFPAAEKIQETGRSDTERPVSLSPDEIDDMTVMGREYTDKAAAGAELLALCQTVVQRGEAMEIGSYRGFAMRLEYRAMEQAFVVGLRGAAVYFAELGTDVQGNLARLNNALNGMEAHLKKLTQEISEIEKQQENTRQELEKPFVQEQELAEKEARLSAVNALLNIDGKNSIPDLMDDTLDIEPPQRAAKDYER